MTLEGSKLGAPVTQTPSGSAVTDAKTSKLAEELRTIMKKILSYKDKK
jgi:hypothetical protein